MKKLSILGAGAWGTALASALSARFDSVQIWTHLAAEAEQINNKKLSYTATSSLEEALESTTTIISAVPSFAIRETWLQVKPFFQENCVMINASKGIEKETHLLPYQLFETIFENKGEYFSLCGPSFATEVAQNKPTAVVIAGKNQVLGKQLIELFQTESFFLSYSSDIVGVEIAAILKNVIAIASGMALGLDYGPNTQSLIIVEGIHEMVALGEKMGALPQTFFGLAGVGDLLLTAMNTESRNMRLGMALGKGIPLKEAMESLKGVPEGYYSTFSLEMLMKKYDLSLPLFQMIVEVILYKKQPHLSVKKMVEEIF